MLQIRFVCLLLAGSGFFSTRAHAADLPRGEAYEVLVDPNIPFTDVSEALALTYFSPDPNVRSAGRWVFDDFLGFPSDSPERIAMPQLMEARMAEVARQSEFIHVNNQRVFTLINYLLPEAASKPQSVLMTDQQADRAADTTLRQRDITARSENYKREFFTNLNREVARRLPRTNAPAATEVTRQLERLQDD